jgi:hypothetical protein
MFPLCWNLAFYMSPLPGLFCWLQTCHPSGVFVLLNHTVVQTVTPLWFVVLWIRCILQTCHLWGPRIINHTVLQTCHPSGVCFALDTLYSTNMSPVEGLVFLPHGAINMSPFWGLLGLGDIRKYDTIRGCLRLICIFWNVTQEGL